MTNQLCYTKICEFVGQDRFFLVQDADYERNGTFLCRKARLLRPGIDICAKIARVLNQPILIRAANAVYPKLTLVFRHTEVSSTRVSTYDR